MVSSVLLALLSSSSSPGSIIDLGSGAGRDVAYLAEHLPRAKLYGVDNHRGAGKRCLPLWESRRVGDRTQVRAERVTSRTDQKVIKFTFPQYVTS